MDQNTEIKALYSTCSNALALVREALEAVHVLGARMALIASGEADAATFDMARDDALEAFGKASFALGAAVSELKVDEPEGSGPFRALRREAVQAGDLLQVELCDRAIDGDEQARAECRRVVDEAQP